MRKRKVQSGRERYSIEFVMRGKDINIDIEAGRGRTMTMIPIVDGEKWDFSNVGITGELRDIRTDEVTAILECGVTDDNLLEVNFPARESGTEVFVIEMSGDSGEVTRLVNGYVTWGEPKAVELSGIGSGAELEIHINGEIRRALWAWSTEGERQYMRAKAEADRAEAAADEAERYAELAKGLEGIDDTLKEFDEKIHQAVIPNVVTNTWWIGGIDTGVQVTGDKGEKGDAPIINTDGFWEIGGNNTGVKAQGRDGIDGDAVRRVLISSIEDLPELPNTEEEAKRYRGIFYMVPNGSEYDVYAMLETENNEFSWVNIGDSTAIATAIVHGITKLGTSRIIVKKDGVWVGGLVGVNSDGGLATIPATTSSYGSVQLAGSVVGGLPGDVPTITVLTAHLGEYYYDSDFVDRNYYTKHDIESMLGEVDSGVSEIETDISELTTKVGNNSSEISGIKAEIAEHPTKEYVNTAIKSSYDTIKDNVKLSLFKVVTAGEYAALTPEPNTLYLIPE